MNDASGHEWPVDRSATKNVWLGETYLNSDDSRWRKAVFGQMVKFFEQMVQILIDEFSSIQRAFARQDDSDVLLTKGEEEHISYLQQAITHGQSSLRMLTRSVHPFAWASAHASLSEAYYQATRYAVLRERYSGCSAMQEQALRHIEAALQVFTPHEHTLEWVRAQRVLGMIYTERVCGSRHDNLARARDCYESALQACDCEYSPSDWATLYLLLGAIFLLEQEEPAQDETC